MISEETQLKFGFKFGQAGAHASRTIMLAELTLLFEATTPNATFEAYREAIEQMNVLNKGTSKTRTLTFRHLVDLYGLDNRFALFRAFRRLWDADEAGQPVLACQLALMRDALLRLSQQKILSLELHEVLPRADMERVFEERFPQRFSAATLRSLAQNINASWTHAGFLTGRSKKYRDEPIVRPANVVFALFAAYLQGATGNRLFISEWLKVLERREEELLELALFASHAGLISFKHASEIIEVGFPNYLTKEEGAWLHE
ncbi:hypothetical protein [Thiopseudomonas alkaliphila]|uniref:hypothetical protein n=1 Tax=Thiopseudomonas alkaliphila TaxID=1697053 RepID=UPI00069D8B9D|nr:hypothetical protein [Thiopseudomonas alkaliphila]